MTPQLPTLKQVPSPNYSSRGGARISKIVVHDTEGSYAGAVAWFTQTRSQVSAHLVMREDGGEVTQMVPLNEKAWHVCNLNPATIGIEGAGVEAQGFSDAWWRSMATIVAWLLHRYQLPCRWAAGGAGDGFCSHHDLGQAGGGHGDPVAVGAPTWTAFVQLVGDAFQAFDAGPLPDWALHGLPAPSAISAAPAAPGDGATSHGGAPGVEPGELRSAPVVGSLLWVQKALVALGVNSLLACDGLNGPQTIASIARFQGAHGLYVDGVAGAQTIAALEKALAAG